ncbi:hypothetical protein ACVWZR_004408 [Bradyrhizobium sp. i1.3.1]
MRQSRWTPSLVPAEESTVYLVADDFGRAGRAWREADLETTDLETVIQDLTSGEYRGPIKVIAFSTRQSVGPKTSPRMLPAKFSAAVICN